MKRSILSTALFSSRSRCRAGLGLALAIAGLLLGQASSSAQCNYSITLPPGFSMIANQCNKTNAGGNTLNNLYPSVPAGSKITKWDKAGQVFEPSAVFSGGVWTPNLTLNPGEGAFFLNPTASAITLSSSGTTPTPNLPLALPSPGCSIVSRQQPLAGGYNDIVGHAPQPQETVFRFVSGIQSYRVWSFDEFDLVWINAMAQPEEPMANVGESIWVCRGVAPPNPPTNGLPVVNLVQPTNGAVFSVGTSIRLRLNASVSSGTLSNVSFFAGTTLLKRTWTTLTNVIAETTWTNAPAGMHQLHAEAEDNVGNRGVSASVQITVTNSPPPNNLPVVSLIQPQNATTFPAGDPILLRANASDSDGTLTNIDFFANAALLGRIAGTLTNGVYSLMWSNPQPGIYSLRAEAVDDAGGRGVSAPLQVSVGGAITDCQFSITVPPGFSMIANQCNNTNAGGNTLNNLYPGVPAGSKITKWDKAGQVFEPSAVFSGGVWSPNLTLNPGEGASFENPTVSAITLTSFGATPTPHLPLALPSPGCAIVSRQQPLVGGYNDIVGHAPPPGEVVLRFVSGIQSYSVYVFDEFDLIWTRNGAPDEPMANVGESIWVCRGAFPPLNFPTNDLPIVNLFQPTNGAVFSVGTSILLRADASDSDGTLTNIQFFAGTTLLRNISGTLTNGVYSFMWSNSPPGMHILRAEAVDNVGRRGVSAPVQVSVSATGNVRPVVTVIRPADGAAFASGIPILMTADGSVPVGSITNVEFRANATLLHRFSGQAGSNSSFSFNWTTAPVGTHLLRAVAWGNAGGVGTSAPVQITVTGTNTPPTNVVPVVNWIRPTNGASFPASTISLTVRATDADGSLIYVEFFATTTNQPSITVNLGRTDPADPPTNGLFTVFWSNAPAGSFRLQAVGVDNFGARGFSDLVEIMVDPGLCNCSITVPPGFSMIANQCNNNNVGGGGNTLNNLYPGVPEGSKITKWNQAGQVFEPAAVFSGGVWSPNLTLNPGEGAFFLNPTASAITLTSSGTTPTPILPLAVPNPGCFIASRQQPLAGGYNDIVGLPPAVLDTVFRFVPETQSYSVYVFDEFDLIWTRNGTPDEPMANVGESIWVCRGASPPLYFPSNSLPVVSIIQPTNASVFPPGSPILVRANASDSDGTLTNINFFANAMIGRIGGALTNGVYSLMWSNSQPGMYSVRAEVYDSVGGRSVSDPVLVSVTGVTNPPSTNCTFALSPDSANFSAGSATGLVSVTTAAGCAWSVVETESWITIVSPLSGSGTGTVAYTLTDNASPVARTGYITIGGQLFTVTQMGTPLPPAPPVEIPPVEVTTLGHAFGSNVVDYLIDQDQSSGGGGVLPSVSVNWDTNYQFNLKVSAPQGIKFVVNVPPGRVARFGGFLLWESTRGGFCPSGPVTATFADLEGTAPGFDESDSVLSDSHGYFGFVDVVSTEITDSLAFTSVTLTGTVAPQYTGNGTEDYTPHLGSFLQLSYATTGTNDPGSFVSFLPTGPMPMMRVVGMQPEGGFDIMIFGKPGLTHIVECSPDTVKWIPINTVIMPPAASVRIKDASATTGDNRFYRVIEMP